MATKATSRRLTSAKAATPPSTVVPPNGKAPSPQALQELLRALSAARDGNFAVRLPARRGTIMGEIAIAYNQMAENNARMSKEVTRVAREVGTEGKLGGQAKVKGVSGTWKDLTDSVNYMASNLTAQVRDIAQVTTAVAKGDLSQKITVDVKGEILELKNTINVM